jgi:exodeoxyribonuclease VII small subunit
MAFVFSRGSGTMSSKKKLDLEKSLADLEALVEDLEDGDLPLEKAMQKFEEGIRLTRGCQAALRDAEHKVQILLKSTGEEEILEDFLAEDEDFLAGEKP